MSLHTNWSGTVFYAARQIHTPDTVDELRALVASSRRIRALGTAHSFSDVADTDGDLVSLAQPPADRSRSTARPAPPRWRPVCATARSRGPSTTRGSR